MSTIARPPVESLDTWLEQLRAGALTEPVCQERILSASRGGAAELHEWPRSASVGGAPSTSAIDGLPQLLAGGPNACCWH